MTAPPLVLYDSPNCWKCVDVREALARLGVEYRSVRVGRDADAAADVVRWTGAFQVPVLRDGDLVVWDRRRILRHLEEAHGGGPPGPPLPGWMGGERRIAPGE